MGLDTRYNEKFSEHYHNQSGAWRETLSLYIRSWYKILDKDDLGDTIVDIGTGLGYNLLSAFWILEKKKFPDFNIEIPDPQSIHSGQTNSINKEFPQIKRIASFEQFPPSMQELKEVSYPSLLSPYLPLLEKIFSKDNSNSWHQDRNQAHSKFEKERAAATDSALKKPESDESKIIFGQHCKIHFHLGDLRKKIKTLKEKSVILWFWDPFSPGKNSDLWSLDLFRVALQASSPDSLLITYSAAKQVRAALLRAGWQVYSAQGLYPKKEFTLALYPRHKKDDRLSKFTAKKFILEDLSFIDRVAFRDRKLDSSAEEIRLRRVKCREKIRACTRNETLQ